MSLKKASLLFPIILIVMTSGCTAPGGLCIPFLPCDSGMEYADDVIVIKSLDALPQKVTPGQQIRLVTYIQNMGKDPVPQSEFNYVSNLGISVDLYDYCEGLFSVVKTSCGGQINSGLQSGSNKCENMNLLPGEVKEIGWTIKANNDVKLRTECDFKVSVTYPYKTTSLTMISFIDYQEMQRQLQEGTMVQKGSYIVSGYGPVKPRITVEGQQPIPVQNNEPGRTVISLKIKNSGNGYLCRLDTMIGGDVVCDGKLPKNNVLVTGIGDQGGLVYSTEPGASCSLLSGSPSDLPGQTDYITLIRDESPPLLCQIELSSSVNLPKETTKHITTEIEYLYEFRKETTVVIEPII